MKEYNPDVSLYTGASGVSLYMSCFEQTFLTSQELRKKTTDRIELIQERFDSYAGKINNYNAIIVYAEIILHLIQLRKGGVIDFSVTKSLIDSESVEILIEGVKFFFRNNFWDFLDGGGVLAWALLEMKEQNLISNSALFDDLVALIYSKAIEENGMIYWESFGLKDKVFTINLGLAHGIPGIIVILRRLLPHVSSQKHSLILSMISKALSFFEVIRNSPDIDSSLCFPGLLKRDKSFFEDKKKTLLAWCYGDLSVGRAYSCSLGLGEEFCTFAKSCKEIIDNAYHRDFTGERFWNNIGLCHGAASAVILSRYYASLFYNHKKCYHNNLFEDNLYKKLITEVEHVKGLESLSLGVEMSFLEGLAGAGLSLLSLVSSSSTLCKSWKSLLMLE